MTDHFAHLDSDPLAAMFEAPKRPAPAKPAPAAFDTCPKCRGSRVFYSTSGRVVGPCFACKGKGGRPVSAAVVAKRGRIADAVEAFKISHADVWEWMDGSTFAPAVEMREALLKYGSLFDSRIEFARRMIAKRNEAHATAQAEKRDRIENAQPVNTSALEAAFAKAAASNGRRALWIGSVQIKPAAKHPGVLYVVDRGSDQYLGKVADGKFTPSRDGRAREAEMLTILQDPKAAAIRHGKLTGACSVCNRTLTDAASIAAGIGPVCASNMGW